jgi:ribonuclease BN (tRNA processing enzyme)
MSLELKIWGSRGSIAQPHKDFMEYGGNTASVTVRTPSGSLIFLDAGTGIQYAAREELAKTAEKIYLGISHTHADHILGLGMSPLTHANYRPEYKGKKISLMGPPGVVRGLQQYYDGEIFRPAGETDSDNKSWPVAATDDPKIQPNMPAIDFGHALELEENKIYQIDEATTLQAMKGNHPVRGGSVFYKLTSNGHSVAYATDNEFDFKSGGVPNPDAESYKMKFVEFIKDADVVITDAQYTREEYLEKKPLNVQGFGHSYIDQVIDLAEKAKARKVVPFHHHTTHTDGLLAKIEQDARSHAKKQGYSLEIAFAKEGMVIEI